MAPLLKVLKTQIAQLVLLDFTACCKREFVNEEDIFRHLIPCNGADTEITDIRLDDHGAVCSVITELGAVFHVKAAVICTGTYLDSRVIIGDYTASSGPDGLHAAKSLTANLEKLGIRIMRFKTGTPPRIDSRTIDYSKLERQEGEKKLTPYSADTKQEDLEARPKLPCYIAYTNETTHSIIRNNIDRSPLYSGEIHGVGPRYCPSIEDKVVRFPDKTRHQLFVEPTGLGTNEMYLQGFSSSMPADVQLQMLRSIEGFENAVTMRSAYAIEYDCIDSTQLDASLSFKKIPGLYGAGQFNGTSGYEEAAAQGLIAGMNATLYVQGRTPIMLTRDSSYIGTLIDDLVTKGTNEPYRMMTSRSEYRLLLRQDNADARLSKIGHDAGLLSDEAYERYLKKEQMIAEEKERLFKIILPPSEKVNSFLQERGEVPIKTGIRMSDLLRRPEITYDSLAPLDPDRPKLPDAVTFTVQTEIKYEGYIKKQLADAQRFTKLEKRLLPQDIDYHTITGLSTEAVQKLNLCASASCFLM